MATEQEENIYPIFVLKPSPEDSKLCFRGVRLDDNFIPATRHWTNWNKSRVERARGMKLPPVVSEAHYLLYFKNFLKIEDWE
jgi:hypothetical protein